MPASPLPRYGLRGRVVPLADGPDSLPDAVVWIADGRVQAVTALADRPAAMDGAPVVRTGGTIYPGLVELHNHLAYNTLPLFPITKQYDRREAWQGTKGYRR